MDLSTDQTSAAAYAGTILENRNEILERWSELLEVDPELPAGAYIRDQLDASILAFAGWVLDTDPASTSMAMKWTEIRPTRELIAGAVTAFGMLPEAVRIVRSPQHGIEIERLAEKASEFAREMISWILLAARFDVDEDRWQEVANEIETRYRDQRIQRVKRLGVLIDIAHAVSTVGDLEHLFDHVHRAIARVFDCDFTEVSILDPATETLRTNLMVVDNQRRRDLEERVQEYGLAHEVVRENRGIIVSDYVGGCIERRIGPNVLLVDGIQRAWMGSPLRIGNQTVGVIAVSCKLSSFEQEDLELLDAVSRQASVALENRRLIEAQRRSMNILGAINELAREISAIRDLHELLATSATRIRELLDFSRVDILIIDKDSGLLSPRAVSCDGGGIVQIDSEVLENAPAAIVTRVMQSGEAVLETGGTPVELTNSGNASGNLPAEMAVPILFSGEMLGVLRVQTPDRCPHIEHDLTPLKTVAEQLAVAIENSRLFAEESQRTRELKLVLQTSRAVGGSLQLDDVLDYLADGLTAATDAHWCQIHLYDREASRFWPVTFRCTDHVQIERLPTRIHDALPLSDHRELHQVLEDRHPFLISCLALDDRSTHIGAGYLIVPLHARNTATGVAILPSTFDPDSSYPESRMRLIQGIADSAALAVENARLYARTHGLAIAEERGRLAQQIHDTIAQGLTAISLQLDLADSYLPAKPDLAAANVRRALELTRDNLNEARRSVLDLQAADVHEMSLPDAITQLLRGFGETTGMNWDFRNQGTSDRLSARVEVGLYRIVEEALENVRRHSNAQHVQVTLTSAGERVSIEVDDDGTGFDPDDHRVKRSTCNGFGLVGIRERARLLGGLLAVSSSIGMGTSVCVMVPFEPRTQPDRHVIVSGGELQ